MKILVTGGAGYIGSHTANKLVERGHSVIVLDNLEHGHVEAIRPTPLHIASVGDLLALRSALPKVDGVIHFAAYTSVAESVKDPLKYYQNNLGETLSLISELHVETQRRGKSIPLVFSSTAATYGAVDSAVPITEKADKNPINPYGFGKLAVERILSDMYAAYHSIPNVCFRYFNAAGAHPSGQNGEDHEPETHLIPLILNAVRDSGTIKVFGTDYPTPDGTCIRDYIHVEDLADAHIKAIEHLDLAGGCHSLNLGSGQGYSVREVIDMALHVTKGSLTVEETSRRAGDPAVLVADPSNAHKILGWKAGRSDLKLIIEDAWKWHSK